MYTKTAHEDLITRPYGMYTISKSPSRYDDLVNILPKTRYVHIESPSRHIKNEDTPQRGAPGLKVFGHLQLLTCKVVYIYFYTYSQLGRRTYIHILIDSMLSYKRSSRSLPSNTISRKVGHVRPCGIFGHPQLLTRKKGCAHARCAKSPTLTQKCCAPRNLWPDVLLGASAAQEGP